MLTFSSPHFVHYVIVVAAVTAVVGIPLLVLRGRSPTIQKMWITYRSWFLIVPVIFVTIGLGRPVVIVCSAALCTSLVREFARATGLEWPLVAIAQVAILCMHAAAWLPSPYLFNLTPIAGVILIVLFPVVQNKYEGMTHRIGLGLVALIYLGWFPAHLALLTNRPEWPAYLLFLVWGTELNDAWAWLTGHMFGKHKLLPKVSPGKTIEGFVGSLVLTACYIWGLRSCAPALSTSQLLLSLPVLWCGGTAGDLVISVIKRDVGVKDMGTLIPGHGGLLDRFDSLVLTSPLFFHLMGGLP